MAAARNQIIIEQVVFDFIMTNNCVHLPVATSSSIFCGLDAVVSGFNSALRGIDKYCGGFSMNVGITSGSLVEIRGDVWRVNAIVTDEGENCLHCIGVEGITRGQEARFFSRFEQVTKVDPAAIKLIPDLSPGFEDSKLFLEAAFQRTPAQGSQPTVLGGAAIDDLKFQHLPVQNALSMPRVRLLIADDVGLGKTLEAGLVASELIARGRAKRILVVTTRAMLAQFQKEFWTRFSIPLARLDGSAIKRMRNRIPAHYNVFDQFERSIVSIDTLKRDLGIRTALEDSYWDLVIIDEAHNAAVRKSATSGASLRARLAKLLSRRADNLLLLTATPHDGSKESFASLIQMLDPTRVPDPETVTREDIEDLVIRRFRTTREVKDAIDAKVPNRQLNAHSFPISGAEDEAYRMIADLKLDMDQEKGRGKASQLFRTTLAKAVFSSPMACFETVQNRIKRISSGTVSGSTADVEALTELRDQLAEVDAARFAKYQNLLEHLRSSGWNPNKKRDRIVIFSERLRTLSWLEENLKRDLGLPDEAIGRVDGASAEADEAMQKLLEDFGQEPAKIRILLASDMASEGLNLHFQCHRLIHFDLPWSLIRFQQRNGRIDRYGQDRQPLITYFVGESTHERVRDMWVLDRLVAKDEAAQEGVGDPAVFLGQGDIDGEEEVVAEAVAGGIGGSAFEAQMDENLKQSQSQEPEDFDLDALLFGEYDGVAASEPDMGGSKSFTRPSFYPDGFGFVNAAMARFSRDGDRNRILKNAPKVDMEARSIRFDLPQSMMSTDSFGYAGKNDVDDRFMPVEAMKGKEIALTDDQQTINTAIDRARFDERAWPEMQYLWQVHPIMDWLADAASQLFSRREVPLIGLPGKLAPGEVALLMTGSISKQRGATLLSSWGVVRVLTKDALNQSVSEVQDVDEFLTATGFVNDTPNRQSTDPASAGEAIRPAIEKFQDYMEGQQRQKIAELDDMKAEQYKRLNAFRGRFETQLELKFGAENNGPQNLADRRRQKQKEDRRHDIEEMFGDWEEWFEQTATLKLDRHPFVDIKAVFQG